VITLLEPGVEEAKTNSSSGDSNSKNIDRGSGSAFGVAEATDAHHHNSTIAAFQSKLRGIWHGNLQEHSHNYKIHPDEGVLMGRTVSKASTKITDLIHWNYGELRGGTPAHKINDREYFSFFHSSHKLPGNGIRVTYFIGAYTFSSSPPFHLIRVSPVPLVPPGNKFYSGQWNSKRLDYVIFASGYIFTYIDEHGKEWFGNELSDIVEAISSSVLPTTTTTHTSIQRNNILVLNSTADDHADTVSVAADTVEKQEPNNQPQTQKQAAAERASRLAAQSRMSESNNYEGVHLLVSFGYQDVEGWTAKINLRDLLHSMIHLQQ
jgi:hypothetical protein